MTPYWHIMGYMESSLQRVTSCAQANVFAASYSLHVCVMMAGAETWRVLSGPCNGFLLFRPLYKCLWWWVHLWTCGRVAGCLGWGGACSVPLPCCWWVVSFIALSCLVACHTKLTKSDTHNRLMALCLGLPGVSRYQNSHPLTPMRKKKKDSHRQQGLLGASKGCQNH